MTTALEAAKQHLAALAGNHLPHGEKPSAFHHGLITSLVSEVERMAAELTELRTTAANQAETIERLQAENRLVHQRMDWTIADNVKKAIENADLRKVADAAIRLKVELDVDEDAASDDFEATEDLLKVVREYLRLRALQPEPETTKGSDDEPPECERCGRRLWECIGCGA